MSYQIISTPMLRMQTVTPDPLWSRAHLCLPKGLCFWQLSSPCITLNSGWGLLGVLGATTWPVDPTLYSGPRLPLFAESSRIFHVHQACAFTLREGGASLFPGTSEVGSLSPLGPELVCGGTFPSAWLN